MCNHFLLDRRRLAAELMRNRPPANRAEMKSTWESSFHIKTNSQHISEPEESKMD
jgi:hypothetical protein